MKAGADCRNAQYRNERERERERGGGRKRKRSSERTGVRANPAARTRSGFRPVHHCARLNNCYVDSIEP